MIVLCFFVYYNHRTANPNPYAEWVETYASEDFTEGTRLILEFCDRIAAEADDKVREEMNEAYLIAAEYEWAFWDWGYNGK